MSWLSRFRKADYQGNPSKAGRTTVTLHAKVAKKREWGANKVKDELKRRETYSKMYEETIAGALLDDRTNTFFGSGYTLYCEEGAEEVKIFIQSELDRMGFDLETPTALTEAYIQGYGIMEKVRLNNSTYILEARSSRNILPIYSDAGFIIGWKQVLGDANSKKEIIIDSKDVIVLVPKPSFTTIGVSLIERAREELEYLKNTTEACAQGIWQHGFPWVEAEINDTDAPVDVARSIGRNLDEKNPQSNYVSGLGTKLVEHGMNGIAYVTDYQTWGLRNVANLMESPVSKLGIQENSQATAVKHYEDYYKRISSEQKRIAATIQKEIINDILLSNGYAVGTVTIEFDNPDPDDLLKRADTVSKLIQAYPLEPEYIITREQAAEFVLGKKAAKHDSTNKDIATDIMQRLKEQQLNAGGV